MYLFFLGLISFSCSISSGRAIVTNPIKDERADSAQRIMLFDDSGLLRAVQNIPEEGLLDISVSCQSSCPHELTLQRTDGLQTPVVALIGEDEKTAQFRGIGRGTWKIAGTPGDQVLGVTLLVAKRREKSPASTTESAAASVEGPHETLREPTEVEIHRGY